MVATIRIIIITLLKLFMMTKKTHEKLRNQLWKSYYDNLKTYFVCTRNFAHLKRELSIFFQHLKWTTTYVAGVKVQRMMQKTLHRIAKRNTFNEKKIWHAFHSMQNTAFFYHLKYKMILKMKFSLWQRHRLKQLTIFWFATFFSWVREWGMTS